MRGAAGESWAALGLRGAAAGRSSPAPPDSSPFNAAAPPSAPWQGPACADNAVLTRIPAHSAQPEAAYWHTGVKMAHITGARETTFRDWDPPIIATRFCTGSAYLTDGRQYNLVYWLRSEQGFAGVNWGVQFCLVGRDREYAYAPACRMLRPL
mgnify:CR=1 FL=1